MAWARPAPSGSPHRRPRAPPPCSAAARGHRRPRSRRPSATRLEAPQKDAQPVAAFGQLAQQALANEAGGSSERDEGPVSRSKLNHSCAPASLRVVFPSEHQYSPFGGMRLSVSAMARRAHTWTHHIPALIGSRRTQGVAVVASVSWGVRRWSKPVTWECCQTSRSPFWRAGYLTTHGDMALAEASQRLAVKDGRRTRRWNFRGKSAGAVVVRSDGDAILAQGVWSGWSRRPRVSRCRDRIRRLAVIAAAPDRRSDRVERSLASFGEPCS